MQRAIKRYTSQSEIYGAYKNQHFVEKRHMVLTFRNHPITVFEMNTTNVLAIQETSKFPSELLERTKIKLMDLQKAYEEGFITDKAFQFFLEKNINSIAYPYEHIIHLGNSFNLEPIFVSELNREVSSVLVWYDYKDLGDIKETKLDLGTFRDCTEKYFFLKNLLQKQAEERGYIIVYNAVLKTFKYYHYTEIDFTLNLQSESIRQQLETVEFKNKYPKLYSLLQKNKPFEFCNSNSINESIS